MGIVATVLAVVFGLIYIIGVSSKIGAAKQKDTNNQPMPENKQANNFTFDVFKQSQQKNAVPNSPAKPKSSINYNSKNTITTMKPTIVDHMHGTTTVTSEENCHKPHNGSYGEKYKFSNIQEEEKIELSQSDVEKAIIFGEIINNPAFKRRYKR